MVIIMDTAVPTTKVTTMATVMAYMQAAVRDTGPVTGTDITMPTATMYIKAVPPESSIPAPGQVHTDRGPLQAVQGLLTVNLLRVIKRTMCIRTVTEMYTGKKETAGSQGKTDPGKRAKCPTAAAQKAGPQLPVRENRGPAHRASAHLRPVPQRAVLKSALQHQAQREPVEAVHNPRAATRGVFMAAGRILGPRDKPARN